MRQDSDWLDEDLAAIKPRRIKLNKGVKDRLSALQSEEEHHWKTQAPPFHDQGQYAPQPPVTEAIG
jgi:hypothetical protein